MEEVGTPLDKVCFSCNSEKGGGMLFPAWVISILDNWGEVFFDRTGRGWLTRRLTHSSGSGVILAVGVVAEAGMLEGVTGSREWVWERPLDRGKFGTGHYVTLIACLICAVLLCHELMPSYLSS